MNYYDNENMYCSDSYDEAEQSYEDNQSEYEYDSHSDDYDDYDSNSNYEPIWVRTEQSMSDIRLLVALWLHLNFLRIIRPHPFWFL